MYFFFFLHKTAAAPPHRHRLLLTPTTTPYPQSFPHLVFSPLNSSLSISSLSPSALLPPGLSPSLPRSLSPGIFPRGSQRPCLPLHNRRARRCQQASSIPSLQPWVRRGLQRPFHRSCNAVWAGVASKRACREPRAGSFSPPRGGGGDGGLRDTMPQRVAMQRVGVVGRGVEVLSRGGLLAQSCTVCVCVCVCVCMYGWGGE